MGGGAGLPRAARAAAGGASRPRCWPRTCSATRSSPCPPSRPICSFATQGLAFVSLPFLLQGVLGAQPGGHRLSHYPVARWSWRSWRRSPGACRTATPPASCAASACCCSALGMGGLAVLPVHAGNLAFMGWMIVCGGWLRLLPVPQPPGADEQRALRAKRRCERHRRDGAAARPDARRRPRRTLPDDVAEGRPRDRAMARRRLRGARQHGELSPSPAAPAWRARHPPRRPAIQRVDASPAALARATPSRFTPPEEPDVPFRRDRRPVHGRGRRRGAMGRLAAEAAGDRAAVRCRADRRAGPADLRADGRLRRGPATGRRPGRPPSSSSRAGWRWTFASCPRRARGVLRLTMVALPISFALASLAARWCAGMGLGRGAAVRGDHGGDRADRGAARCCATPGWSGAPRPS